MADSSGVEEIGEGVTKTFKIGGNLLTLHRIEGSEGFWLTLATSEYGEEIANFHWYNKQAWKFNSSECNCDVRSGGA